MAFWDANLTYKVGLKIFDPKLFGDTFRPEKII
jgi:hypothetical protein